MNRIYMHMQRKYSSRLFEEIILKSWWVILFFLVSFFTYDQALYKRNEEQKILSEKFYKCQQDKKLAMERYQELKQNIQSLQDPDWIEIVLMQRLGLVPEGQIKVYFLENAGSQ